MFRSEDMTLQNLICHKDNVWDVVNMIGQLDKVEFINLNRNRYDPKKWQET